MQANHRWYDYHHFIQITLLAMKKTLLKFFTWSVYPMRNNENAVRFDVPIKMLFLKNIMVLNIIILNPK